MTGNTDKDEEEQPTRPEPPSGSLIMRVRVTPIGDEGPDETKIDVPTDAPVTR